MQQNSDDETNDDQESTSTIAQANVLVEVLQVKIPEIAVILQNDHDGTKMADSLDHEQQSIPLGQQRLRTVELVLKMVQMRKEAIYEGLGRSKVFGNIVALVRQYPWNNYLQLKVVALFNEVIDNCENNEFRKQFLESSGVGKALVEMGDNAQYAMGSTRTIRNGYMNLVITIANKLQKKYNENGAGSANEDQTVYQYLDSVGEEWRVFVDKELAQSNENNQKTLGGCTTRKDDPDDDNENENNYDSQMEKIMQRFTNFNQILSQGSSNDDEEDDEDEDTNEDSNNFDEDDDADKDSSAVNENASDAGVKIQKVEIKETEAFVQEYADNTFWSLPSNNDDADIDSLMAELEA